MCKYCEGKVDDRDNIIDSNTGFIVYIDGNSDLCLQDRDGMEDCTLINYCSMCGRKLGD